MGLSSFNRARRSMIGVNEIEVERFKEDNAKRWAAHRSLDKTQEEIDEDLETVREAEAKGVAIIGEKVVAGIKSGEEGGPIDLPLREDHAAEIAGRIVMNTQEPIDLMDRLHERIPDGTANEELVKYTSVEQEGPTPELVAAATVESTGQATATYEETKQVKAEKAETLKTMKAEQKTAAEQQKARIAAEEKAQEGLPAAGNSAGAGKEPSSSSAGGTSKSEKTAAPKK